MILARVDSLSGSSIIRFDGKAWLIGSIIVGEVKGSVDLHVRQCGGGTEWVWITLNRRDLVEVIPRQGAKWPGHDDGESEPIARPPASQP